MEPPKHRVLVIDDDSMIRSAIAMALSDHHVVAEAGSCEVALEMIRERTFDVIVCDVMLPGQGGREIYAHIRARHPGLERRVVFITGGSYLAKVREFLDSVDNLKLLKPFTLDQVLAAVETAADR